MEQPIISLNGVVYSYSHAAEGEQAAVDGISLDIAAGEFVGLVGANGSGKSTLAKMLNALLLPSAGEVRIAGMSTSDKGNHDHIREKAGMVFQNPESQIVATTVADDIAFGLENLGVPPEEIEDRIAEAAARFGLTDLLDREPHWLSGGQKQRTALAGVVALKPEILVLDEPTSMLDPLSQQDFHQLVVDLWRQGTTVIYITHLMEELVMATRIIALSRGCIAFDGPARELFQRKELLQSTGLEAPLAVRLSLALADHGHHLEPSLTLEELAGRVCA